MAVYISGTVVSLFLAYVATHIGRSGRLTSGGRKVLPWLFALLSFVPLTFIMAVRYNVGTDYMSYRYMFLHGSKTIEGGYRLLNQWLKNSVGDPQSIFIVSAIMICGGYYFSIYKESANPVYSILLFVLCKDYFIAMNGMRQYIATATALFSIPYAKKGRWIETLCILAVAFMFHRSVIIFALLYALTFFEIPPLAGGGIVIGTYALSNLIKRYIYPLLQRFGFYDVYFNWSIYSNQTNNFNWRYTLIFLCFFLLLCYEYREVKKSKDLKLLYLSVVLSLLVIAMSAVMPINIARLTWHMDALIVLYIPRALKHIRDKRIRWFFGAAILIAYAVVSIHELLDGNQDVLPYRTIWG